MNWNRVYRPATISGLHLQRVREYFSRLLSSKSFPQVYLFAGPKGTGKTSTARILAAVLNDPANAATVKQLLSEKTKPSAPLREPEESSDQTQKIISGRSYLVQELDAASNRGIDDIRALKETIFTPPASGGVSVYILDEAHMLTTEAFNALLKILEEPPTHAVFILATTELHKIPATITSRCQIVSFAKASSAELDSVIEHILTAEKLKLDAEIRALIVDRADGSFRDCVKLLQLAITHNTTSAAEFTALLGEGSDKAPQLITHVLEKNAEQVMEVFSALRAIGANESAFHRSLLQYLHAQLRAGISDPKVAQVPPAAAQFLLRNLADSQLSQPSPIAFLRLEIVLLDLIHRSQQQSGQAKPPKSQPAVAKQTQLSPPKTTKTTDKTSSKIADPESLPTDTVVTTSISQNSTSFMTVPISKICAEWVVFVQTVAKENFSLATLLKSARPRANDNGILILEVYYSFHLEQLCQPRFTSQLGQLLETTFGSQVPVEFQLSEQPAEAELIENANPALQQLAAEALL